MTFAHSDPTLLQEKRRSGPRVAHARYVRLPASTDGDAQIVVEGKAVNRQNARGTRDTVPPLFQASTKQRRPMRIALTADALGTLIHNNKKASFSVTDAGRMRYNSGVQRPGAAEPAPRKSGGPRSCFKKNGGPKVAFATAKLAERAIPRTASGLKPYRCTLHGWHLGH